MLLLKYPLQISDGFLERVPGRGLGFLVAHGSALRASNETLFADLDIKFPIIFTCHTTLFRLFQPFKM